MPKGVKQYPWDEWLAMPFRTHEAYRNLHFPGDADGGFSMFKQVLRNKANRNGLRVAVVGSFPGSRPSNLVDPVVRFQFYYPDQPKPVLASHTVELKTVTCPICGLVQTRAPHLADVTECLMRNPKDPGDPEMYYAHRNDSDEPSGFARVVLVETIAPSVEAGE